MKSMWPAEIVGDGPLPNWVDLAIYVIFGGVGLLLGRLAMGYYPA